MTAIGNKSSFTKPKWTPWFFLFLFAAALNFYSLGNHGLLEPDEGRYANIALEWTEFNEHNWLEPMMSDVGHYDKPPLIYWATGTSLLIFGRHEWAARIPSVLGGMLTLLGVGLLGYRHYGEKAAFAAVIVCVTSLQFWALSHLLSPDMLLCGFCTLGAALVLWGKARTQWKTALIWIIGALCWTLAWWTKATACLVPLAALCAGLLLSGNKEMLRSVRPLRLILLILLLGSPWYLIMLNRHDELWDFFFVREVVGRIAGHEDGRKGFPGFHFAVAAAFWMPWWPVLFYAAKKKFNGWRNMSLRAKFASIPWPVWSALVFLAIYSFVSSKLITYTLPGLPFIAVAVGRQLGDFKVDITHWHTRLVAAACVFYLIVGVVIPRIESDLSKNSTVKNVINEAVSRGAEVLVMDYHCPGAEFYFEGPVWYVDVRDIAQAHDVQGQFENRYFVSKENIVHQVTETEADIWLIQIRTHPLPWKQKLIEMNQEIGDAKFEVGDFRCIQVQRS